MKKKKKRKEGGTERVGTKVKNSEKNEVVCSYVSVKDPTPTPYPPSGLPSGAGEGAGQ